MRNSISVSFPLTFFLLHLVTFRSSGMVPASCMLGKCSAKEPCPGLCPYYVRSSASFPLLPSFHLLPPSSTSFLLSFALSAFTLLSLVLELTPYVDEEPQIYSEPFLSASGMLGLQMSSTMPAFSFSSRLLTLF